MANHSYREKKKSKENTKSSYEMEQTKHFQKKLNSPKQDKNIRWKHKKYLCIFPGPGVFY
jgi:hypothetical protein